LARSGTRPGSLPARARADDRAAAPAWNWSADELSADELAKLRAAVSVLRDQVAELEPAVARAREREGAARRTAELAAAGLW
jgi:septal ring factor EnvC (AmiA/AmiB activator)